MGTPAREITPGVRWQRPAGEFDDDPDVEVAYRTLCERGEVTLEHRRRFSKGDDHSFVLTRWLEALTRRLGVVNPEHRHVVRRRLESLTRLSAEDGYALAARPEELWVVREPIGPLPGLLHASSVVELAGARAQEAGDPWALSIRERLEAFLGRRSPDQLVSLVWLEFVSFWQVRTLADSNALLRDRREAGERLRAMLRDDEHYLEAHWSHSVLFLDGSKASARVRVGAVARALAAERGRELIRFAAAEDYAGTDPMLFQLGAEGRCEMVRPGTTRSLMGRPPRKISPGARQPRHEGALTDEPDVADAYATLLEHGEVTVEHAYPFTRSGCDEREALGLEEKVAALTRRAAGDGYKLDYIPEQLQVLQKPQLERPGLMREAATLALVGPLEAETAEPHLEPRRKAEALYAELKVNGTAFFPMGWPPRDLGDCDYRVRIVEREFEALAAGEGRTLRWRRRDDSGYDVHLEPLLGEASDGRRR